MTLQDVVNSYFVDSNTLPIKSYTEQDLLKILLTIGHMVGNDVVNYNGILQPSTVKYIKQEAAIYGIDATKFYNYVSSRPDIMQYIYQTWNDNTTSADFPISEQTGALGKAIGDAVGGGVGSFITNLFGGLLKGLLPVLIIVIVIFIAYQYSKKSFKSTL